MMKRVPRRSSSEPETECGLPTSRGQEIVNCLRLNGLSVEITPRGPDEASLRVTPPGEATSPAVTFDRRSERAVLTELARRHCSAGQWIRMSYYDGFPPSGGDS